MRGVAPLPPPIPLTGAMEIPVPTLAPPTIKPFEWEPVPIYVEDCTTKAWNTNVPPGLKKPVPDEPEDNSMNKRTPNRENQETAPNNSTEQPNIMPSGKPTRTSRGNTWQKYKLVEVPFTEIEVPVPRVRF